jgi:hypothetical protein
MISQNDIVAHDENIAFLPIESTSGECFLRGDKQGGSAPIATTGGRSVRPPLYPLKMKNHESQPFRLGSCTDQSLPRYGNKIRRCFLRQ